MTIQWCHLSREGRRSNVFLTVYFSSVVSVSPLVGWGGIEVCWDVCLFFPWWLHLHFKIFFFFWERISSVKFFGLRLWNSKLFVAYCVMRYGINCAVHQTLLVCLNQDGCDGVGMWHLFGRREILTLLWWANTEQYKIWETCINMGVTKKSRHLERNGYYTYHLFSLWEFCAFCLEGMSMSFVRPSQQSINISLNSINQSLLFVKVRQCVFEEFWIEF